LLIFGWRQPQDLHFNEFCPALRDILEEIAEAWRVMEAGEGQFAPEEEGRDIVPGDEGRKKHTGVRKERAGKFPTEIRISQLPWAPDEKLPTDFRVWLGSHDDAQTVRRLEFKWIA
jgi:hypothetical protein